MNNKRVVNGIVESQGISFCLARKAELEPKLIDLGSIEPAQDQRQIVLPVIG